MNPKGHAFILSGPSGVGKTAIYQQLVNRVPGLERVITVTTRQPRPGEKHAVDFFFVDEPTFQKMIADDAFLEWAQVHNNHYGTPKRQVIDKLAAGINILMIIDVQGAMTVRAKMPEVCLIFIQPDDPANLIKHLEERRAIPTEERALRLRNAEIEMGYKKDYNFVITNKEGRMKDTVAEVQKAMLSVIEGR